MPRILLSLERILFVKCRKVFLELGSGQASVCGGFVPGIFLKFGFGCLVVSGKF
jgi:hypothetical protein